MSDELATATARIAELEGALRRVRPVVADATRLAGVYPDRGRILARLDAALAPNAPPKVEVDPMADAAESYSGRSWRPIANEFRGALQHILRCVTADKPCSGKDLRILLRQYVEAELEWLRDEVGNPSPAPAQRTPTPEGTNG